MNPIREWAPLSDVLDRIPARIHRGFFPANLNITCVDAVEEFLALGSDGGIVFWYNRSTGEMQKLKTEVNSRITCVKIVNSVEYMVAAGNSTGQLNIFQIQKELPPDLNLVAPCTRIKPIQRYTIRDLHSSSISCCEWSKNGMKLYSGDRQGFVVLTEFDYQSHLSKSQEILSETYEIVQLSVHLSYLLVSSLYRSIICQRHNTTGQWQITQIGKKDRKLLVDCGGVFLKRNLKRPLVICGRPGLRFWIADTAGNVEKTLLFKEAITRSPTWEIPILNPAHQQQQRSSNEVNINADSKNFRALYLYDGQETLIVTHDDLTLYILNLNRLRVEAVARGFRKILDFCVCGKEVFVLEGDRSLLRLAPMPEKPNKKAKIIFNPSMPPPVPLLGASTSGSCESPVEYEPEDEIIINAEECFELPPIEALNLNIPIELAVESPRAEQNRRFEIFNQISELAFDDSILHHTGGASSTSGRKKRKNQNENNSSARGVVEIGHIAVANEEKEQATTIKSTTKEKSRTTKPMLMDASFCTATDKMQPMNLKEAYAQHLPDVLSPTTLERTIEEKTKSLAEELNLPQLHLDPISSKDLNQLKQSHETSTSVTSKIVEQKAQPSQLMQLSQVYPKEDAGVQTSPRQKVYYVPDEANYDYSSGQPIDDICRTLCASALVDNYGADVMPNVAAKETDLTATNDTNKVSNVGLSLQYKQTQPVSDEIDSFLLDFRRAGDPFRKSPPPSTGESTTSSEWEFLDN